MWYLQAALFEMENEKFGMRRVLVTGAGGPAASNFIHSLHLAGGYYIVGTDANKYHLELADVDARYLVPRADQPGFIALLKEIADKEMIDVIHPQPDTEVIAISPFRGHLNAWTFLPAHKTIVRCQDKVETVIAITEFTPEASQATSEKDLREITAAILHNHKKAWIRATQGAGSKASLPVTTPDQAVSWARYWIETRGFSFSHFMVSEFLPGREFAFQSLWREGELITSAARERLEYLNGNLTPSGQSSSPSVARSVRNPAVNLVATQAIHAIDPNPNGVFCVDLKENEEGQPLVTEINAGRFFTTSNFFATAGSNMPDIYISLAMGEEINPDLPPYDAIPSGLYWVRQMDMGFKLIPEDGWRTNESG